MQIRQITVFDRLFRRRFKKFYRTKL